MTFQPLLATAASLLGPVDRIDDPTFANKAQVARLRLPGGGTVVAKMPVDPAAFGRELHAPRVLPEAAAPVWWPQVTASWSWRTWEPGPLWQTSTSAAIPPRPRQP